MLRVLACAMIVVAPVRSAFADSSTACPGSSLARLDISIDAVNKRWLDYKLRRIRERGVNLANELDFLPARLTFEGKSHDIRIRPAGSQSDHWSSDAPTLRVDMRRGGSILGASELTLMHPRTRGSYYEPLFHDQLRREGIASVRHGFVLLSINGAAPKVMAVELPVDLWEHRWRRAPILRGHSIGKLAIKYKAIAGTGNTNWRGTGIWVGGGRFDPGYEGRVAGMMRALQHGLIAPSRVFDPEYIGKYLAIAEMWRAWHSVEWGDMRFYYSAPDDRFYPIAQDISPHIQYPTRRGGPFYEALSSPESFAGALLRDPEILGAALRHLERFTSPEYLADLAEMLREREAGYRALHCGRFADVAPALPFVRERAARLQAAPLTGITDRRNVDTFFPAKMTHSIADYDETPRSATPETFPIAVYGFTYMSEGGLFFELSNALPRYLGRLRDNAVWVTSLSLETSAGERLLVGGAPVKLEEGKPLRFPIEGASERDRASLLRGRLVGRLGRQRAQSVRFHAIPYYAPYVPDDRHASIEELLARYPFMRSEDRRMRIPAGTWSIDRPVVLPEGYALHMDAGATLLMRDDAFIEVHGDTSLTGTEEEPVILRCAEGCSGWGGIYILSGARSEWRHVEIRDVRNRRHGLHGGITVRGHDFRGSFLRVGRIESAAAVNFMEATLSIDNLRISEVSGHALEVDFSKGDIRGLVVERARGGGIDASGSDLRLNGASISRIGDKAISAGERSTLFVEDARISHALIGVAGKDSAIVRMRGGEIRHTVLAAGGFKTRPEFGGGSLSLSGTLVRDGMQRLLADEHSSVWEDGRAIRRSPLSVKKLFLGLRRLHGRTEAP